MSVPEMLFTLGAMLAVAMAVVVGHALILRARERRHRRQLVARFDAFCESLDWRP